MRKIEVKQIDAFTKTPFQGNAAGVVLKAEGLTARQMQGIAKEMNLSETAFVVNRGVSKVFTVRFFTPQNEVDLCGHATIATFHALAETGEIASTRPYSEVVQITKAGRLPVRVFFDRKKPKMVFMGQAKPQFQRVRVDSRSLAALLGIKPAHLDLDHAPIEMAFTGLWHLIVPMKSRLVIDQAKPDYLKLADFNRHLSVVTTHLFTLHHGRRGITCYGRDFAPAAGVNEDPVTGTANGALGAYLVKNDLVRRPSGEMEMVFEQGNRFGRRGILSIRIIHQGGTVSQVWVGGEAVTVMEGRIRV